MKRTDDQSRVRPLPPSRYAPPARRLLRIFDTNSCKICHRPHRRAREPARGTQARTSPNASGVQHYAWKTIEPPTKARMPIPSGNARMPHHLTQACVTTPARVPLQVVSRTRGGSTASPSPSQSRCGEHALPARQVDET
jgi:hypothetical protein